MSHTCTRSMRPFHQSTSQTKTCSGSQRTQAERDDPDARYARLRQAFSIRDPLMDLRDIHVCISAYACDPTRGSEPGIGWNIVREVARRHLVWAITRRRNEAAITAALRHQPLPNLQIAYVD